MQRTKSAEYRTSCPSPLGTLLLAGTEDGLTGLWFEGQRYLPAGLDALPEEAELPVFGETRRWLDIYFAGEFSRLPPLPPLCLRGTPFRRAVWELLLAIPCGETTTYGALARELSRRRGGAPQSAQAVGGAVGHNPVSILVPCHRVVGADGSLTGYAGGLWRKEALLRLEAAAEKKEPISPAPF